MKALIVLNGDCPDPEFLRELSIGRALFAADGGYRHYIRAGMQPCVVVGDMDSMPDELPPSVDVVRYDPEKDHTDGMLAMEEAIRRGADDIVLTCAVSRDMGHSLENIRMMLFSAVPICIEEPDMSIYALRTGDSMEIPEGRRVSVVPLGEEAQLSMKGFRYGMDGVLRERSGVSNISAASASISVKEGRIALFVYR